MFKRFVGKKRLQKSAVKTEQNVRCKGYGTRGLVLKEALPQGSFITPLCGESYLSLPRRDGIILIECTVLLLSVATVLFVSAQVKMFENLKYFCQ